MEFAVHFMIRKGMGPDSFKKTIFVALDDLEPDMTEQEIKDLAISQAEGELYKNDDYKVYGKNWTLVDFERT